MKKNIYIVLFGLLLSMGIASCDNNSDLLFDETAAQRKAGANKAYDTALKSSEQGWLFQYFPEENQKYGGYNYVVKFAANGEVTVWYEGMADLTKPETSMYDVISYGGPVLTFNTYNSLMHKFANPSASEYLGKGGDYEFLIISNENDVITLKGIKTSNVLRMTKMKEAAEVYLVKINTISNLFKGSSLEATINKSKVALSLNDHRMVFSYTENKEAKSEKAAFIPTPTGISFYEPLTILGVTVQELSFNVETNQLVSANNEIIIDIIKAPVDLTSARWTCDTDVAADRSVAVRTAWIEAYVANGKTYGEILETTFSLGIGAKGIGFYTKSNKYATDYHLNFGGVLGHPDYLNLTKKEGGFNWKWYTHLMPLLNIVTDNTPYSVEMDNADNPTQVKMTSVANPDVWFILRK
ncbi:DUF4302 domain-containing protein [Sulfurimonas sp.]|uniref:DUF4302 domain-containing protein n=1 Tax=Sulfurimonas sp. TaxID=2022749 RepID=UPI0025F7F1AF|nr:DUF4302 domain-containing protein [Sulfurimonas sp.]